MTNLLFIWIGSLVVLAGVLLFSLFRARNMNTALFQRPEGFREFIIDALGHLLGHFSHVAISAEPHARKIGLLFFHFGKRGHDVFSERVFGKVVSERGKTASFFLKHIAENKENSRKIFSKQKQY